MKPPQVSRLLAPHSSAAVLELESADGLFCGFVDPSLDRKFREETHSLLTYHRTPFCMMEGSDNAPLFSQCCSPRKPGDKFFPCIEGFPPPDDLPACSA